MQRPSLLTMFYAVVLVASAIPVLYEPLRHAKAFSVPFMLLLSPALLILMLRRAKAEGTGHLTIPQLYQKARTEGGLQRSPLETSAEIAFVLAAMLIIFL